ncbi:MULTISPECIES: four-carbon acid sugar kinase family protein [Paenibacillus]|uniref:four-carbon acid sugar kinase family protein n=1 Tax=Paenibacillus TaxID=44249 RepID=UPI0022B8CE2A|nr:four-carbon acid sugar kinase family protein [Paenibacillus caseinilyticus]MCZ8519555.1 four-carbon acid sugar kinase family protein [Paenibacillus caseinilyticus]
MKHELRQGTTMKSDSSRQPLLCYYGDDFTGSTDVLEALSAAGLQTVLFLEPPDEERIRERFPHADCIGVAGVSRSMTPQEMEAELDPIFRKLKALGPRFVHYKVCSTFDSSPEVGSIGRAIEIGTAVFGAGRYVPLIVGVPLLGRYTLFGHHFAAASGGVNEVFRLDRHPTMARHPVTPMEEADLRLHLGRQTQLTAASMDIRALGGAFPEVERRLDALLQHSPGVVLYDVLDESRLAAAGRLIWEEAGRTGGGPLFAAGSSGIEYALTAYLRESGQLQASSPPGSAGGLGRAEPLLVVSGSCSPVTAAQISRAMASGFTGIRVPVPALCGPDGGLKAARSLLAASLACLREGRSVVLYTAAGPGDPAVQEAQELAASLGIAPQEWSRLLGGRLGALARELILAAGLKRIVIAGGDTSGYVTRGLGIHALEWLAATAPGAPVCRAHSQDARLDGLQLVLKGGQMGGEDFLAEVLQGGRLEHSGQLGQEERP